MYINDQSTEPSSFAGRLFGNFKLYLILFLLGFTFSIYIIQAYDIRPIIYYGVVAIIAAIILIEIVSFKITGFRAAAILLQIMALGLNIIYSVTLKYFYYIGRSDILPHTWYAENLLDNGFVTSIFDIYQPFPLWHILTSFCYNVTGLDYPLYKIMFIICGIIYAVLGILSIYLVFTKLGGDRTGAFLSALFLAIFPVFVIYGMYSISRSVASILMMVVFFLLLNREKRWMMPLACFLTLVIIVYHTVSIVFVIFIFLLIYLLQLIFIKDKKERIITPWYLAITIIMVVVYWSLFATDVIARIYDSLISPAPMGITTESIMKTPINELINYSQYSIFLLFIFLGVLAVLLSRTFNNKIKIVGIATLLIVPLSLPGPLLLINKLAVNFNLSRFDEYSFIFMATLCAIGFRLLYQKPYKTLKVLCVILFVLMAFLSVSNDFVSSDNPLVKRVFYTYYFTENEYDSINRFANDTVDYVMSDYLTIKYLDNSPYYNNSHIMELDVMNKTILTNSQNDTILLRSAEAQIRPLQLYEAVNGTYIRLPSWNDRVFYHSDIDAYTTGRMNRVFDSEAIIGFN